MSFYWNHSRLQGARGMLWCWGDKASVPEVWWGRVTKHTPMTSKTWIYPMTLTVQRIGCCEQPETSLIILMLNCSLDLLGTMLDVHVGVLSTCAATVRVVELWPNGGHFTSLGEAHHNHLFRGPAQRTCRKDREDLEISLNTERLVWYIQKNQFNVDSDQINHWIQAQIFPSASAEALHRHRSKPIWLRGGQQRHRESDSSGVEVLRQLKQSSGS